MKVKCECGCLLEKFQYICERCGKDVSNITHPKKNELTSTYEEATIAEAKIAEYIKYCKEKA